MSQAQGGDKILMFCDRVKREDIAIIFYEEKQTVDGPKRTWEYKLNEKNCKSMTIHHQYGIKFNTPSYKHPDITEARQAFIQLHRPSDNEYSKPIPFEFVPNDQTTKSMFSYVGNIYLSHHVSCSPLILTHFFLLLFALTLFSYTSSERKKTKEESERSSCTIPGTNGK